MPSEYEIYRSYAGLNRPQSKLDYFLQGVGKLQGIAESNKRLELQERRLDQQEKRLEQDDKRADERLELSKTQEERMREQYDYNKQKNIEDRKFSKQSQAWNSISSFAGQLPEGQRYNFMMKQAGNIMDDDFMQSQGIYDKMEAFKEAEEDGVAMNDMYFNMRNEDSADKIEQFLNMDVITDNSKKQVLQNRVNSIRKKEKEWEPFDIDLLSFKDRSSYDAVKADYDKKLEEFVKSKTDKLVPADPKLNEKISMLETQLKGYQKRASTAPLPVFTASTESLQAVADDDDLMNAFFGDESNNLDEFIEARSGVPKPVETEVEKEEEEAVAEPQGSIWKPTTTTISIAGGPGGEKQQSEYPTFKLRDDIPEMYKDEKIRGQAMAKMSQDIKEYNSNISKIDENLAQIESAMKGLSGASLERVKAHRKKITIKRQSLEKELKDIQSKYDYLKEPEPEIVVK